MANKKTIFMEGATRQAEDYRRLALETIGRLPGLVESGFRTDPEGITFAFRTEVGELRFFMLADRSSVKRQARRLGRRPLSEKRLGVIAWAQVYEMVRVQAAMIEGGASEVDQAFLAYVEGADGRTLLEDFRGYQLRLTAGGE